MVGSSRIIQENVSTAPTGFSLEGDFTDTVETFEIFDVWNPDWKFRVDAGFSMIL